MATLKLDPEVEQVLRESKIIDNKLFLPARQLDRKLYVSVNKAIEAAQGKWNKKEKCHIFLSDPNKLLFALETGGIEKLVSTKKEFQQFNTPKDLAEYLVSLADAEGRICLEPSAGTGNLVIPLLNICKFVFCIEVHKETSLLLKDNLYKNFPENDNYIVFNDDFLNFEPYDYNDRIERAILNPPFSKNQDCKHVEHAFKCLKPGGKLVAIMANNQTRSCFKNLIKDRVYEIEELGQGKFKSSGTLVNTLILTLNKD